MQAPRGRLLRSEVSPEEVHGIYPPRRRVSKLVASRRRGRLRRGTNAASLPTKSTRSPGNHPARRGYPGSPPPLALPAHVLPRGTPRRVRTGSAGDDDGAGSSFGELLLDRAWLSSFEASQFADAELDLGAGPFASVRMFVELESPCFPFEGWADTPPPEGHNWPAKCDAFDRIPVCTRCEFASTWTDGAGQVSGAEGGWFMTLRVQVDPGPPPSSVLAAIPLVHADVTADNAEQTIAFELPEGTTSARPPRRTACRQERALEPSPSTPSSSLRFSPQLRSAALHAAAFRLQLP